MALYRIYCYPWDLVDEGIDRVLSRFEEAGLDAIAVAAAYHRAQCLRPHGRHRKTYVADASYVYFQPDSSRYREGGIRPEPSPESPHAFAQVVEAAHRYNLRISAWTVALHYSPSYRRYPESWCVNVFGDPYPLSLCPSDPAVQEYVVSLATDIHYQFGVDEIELESVNWDRFFNTAHGLHDRIGLNLGPIDHLALSLCFCSSCMAKAAARGVDVAQLQSRLRQQLDQTFRGDASRRGSETETIAEFVATVPELGQFMNLRADVVTELVSSVRHAVGCPVAVVYYSPDLCGLDATRLSSECDRLLFQAYSGDTQRVQKQAEEALAALPDLARWRPVLSLFDEDIPASDTLARHLSILRQMGFQDFGFYNYGLASISALDQMTAAIVAIGQADRAGTSRDDS